MVSTYAVNEQMTPPSADFVLLQPVRPTRIDDIDPVAAVVLCADVSNVDTVIVGGVVRKRDGKLLADVPSVLAQLQGSTQYLADAVAARAAESA